MKKMSKEREKFVQVGDDDRWQNISEEKSQLGAMKNVYKFPCRLFHVLKYVLKFINFKSEELMQYMTFNRVACRGR